MHEPSTSRVRADCEHNIFRLRTRAECGSNCAGDPSPNVVSKALWPGEAAARCGGRMLSLMTPVSRAIMPKLPKMMKRMMNMAMPPRFTGRNRPGNKAIEVHVFSSRASAREAPRGE